MADAQISAVKRSDDKVRCAVALLSAGLEELSSACAGRLGYAPAEQLRREERLRVEVFRAVDFYKDWVKQQKGKSWATKWV